MNIIEFTEDDFKEVCTIYAEGIATGIATFETSVPKWPKWDQSHLPFGRIAAIEYDRMLGWAALSAVSDRCVYGGVAEVSVYVAQQARRKGVGRLLMQKLIEISERHNIWTLQSGVFRANEASIELHKRCGFRFIGYREKIGKLNGDWFDNVLLERRSVTVGI